jgi:hypothetical protein
LHTSSCNPMQNVQPIHTRSSWKWDPFVPKLKYTRFFKFWEPLIPRNANRRSKVSNHTLGSDRAVLRNHPEPEPFGNQRWFEMRNRGSKIGMRGPLPSGTRSSSK